MARVANFAGVPLSTDGDFGGALYRLGSAPGSSAVLSLDSSVEVEVRGNVSAVVVRSADIDCYEAGTLIGTSAANEGLDLLALRQRPPLGLTEVRDFHAIWWQDSNGSRVLRLVLSHTGRLVVSLTGKVTGPDGKEIQSTPPITGTWSPSMRYFRVAEASDDLFDSFRNIYLAIESLLSDLRPMVNNSAGRRESEEVWFKAALREANKLTDIGSFAPKPDGGDPVHAIWSELCDQLRNAVFHAKTARGPILPQSAAEQKKLLEAKQRYAALYLAVEGVKTFGSTLSPGGSFLSRYARDAMIGGVQSQMEIGLTSDTSPASTEDEALSPLGETTVFRSASPLALPGYEDFSSIMATFDEADLSMLERIGRAGSVGPNRELFVFDSLGDALALDGIDSVEVVLAQDIRGRPGTRDQYAS